MSFFFCCNELWRDDDLHDYGERFVASNHAEAAELYVVAYIADIKHPPDDEMEVYVVKENCDQILVFTVEINEQSRWFATAGEGSVVSIVDAGDDE